MSVSSMQEQHGLPVTPGDLTEAVKERGLARHGNESGKLSIITQLDPQRQLATRHRVGRHSQSPP